ncbi:MAG TPA: glucose-1-phosphate adenylyltransferase [Pirellulaceae bacterium]|nr:glucose-1-phosphate adenylyltransferase [Pirellulaceae bacterium]HMO93123.1 glucose-1-phosphate adenylyltransferase [Pirellulaceae bacterium]HMP70318.1 glucose-1-phosphate adenylyltransferase [Pirellulaceae bacterium]
MRPKVEVLTVILAGGKGSRLEPLTRDRAKPAVPFGGHYRIIDFALSNCLNSGFRQLLVLTQYKATSLERHINLGWRKFFCDELGEFIETLPPQHRIDENWYAGTADAVYQNIYSLEKIDPKYVVILAGDHVYKMNYQKMVDYHHRVGADLTIGALQVPRNEAHQFGVMQVNAHDRIVGFQEKPSDPASVPGDSTQSLVSMGIYVFKAETLFEQLCRDANDPASSRDFGKNVVPNIIQSHQVFAFPFSDENRKTQAYWRDVGTIDSYFDANMDLVSVDPQLNLYDLEWPIRTYMQNLPPAKFVFGGIGGHIAEFQRLDALGNTSIRKGQAVDSLVCNGCIISGGTVQNSVLGANVRVNSFADVSQSVLFDHVEVGRGARIKRAIIDKGVIIPENFEIGYNREMDESRGLMVSEGGVVIIGKGAKLTRKVPQIA